MRFDKTKKGVSTAIATVLLAGGIVAFTPATVSSARTTVSSNTAIVQTVVDDRDRERRASRSSTRTVRPKNVFRPAIYTASGRKMTKSSAKNRVLGRKMAAHRGWKGSQWFCLEDLWSHESQWSTRSGSTSTAYGIPQAYPGTKMSSKGPKWRTHARTQIRWGFGYIRGRYGSPCGAWNAFNSRSPHWY